jgi:putative ABC transport system permease protein
MLQDLRFGLRMLGKQPGFTALAVLTLALGIGSTAAVFSLIEGVLLTPPPYNDPQQLALIQSVRTDGQSSTGVRRWPAQQWMEWQKEAGSFEGIAAYGWTFNFLVSEEGSESPRAWSSHETTFACSVCSRCAGGRSWIRKPVFRPRR